MNDPLVLLLFLATWGGIALLFRRLADDFRKATVRQSDKPAQVLDEELLRITGEVQETIEGLSEAIGKRAEQLRTLIAEADTKIEQLAAAISRGAAPDPAGDAAQGPALGASSRSAGAPHPPEPLAHLPASPAQRGTHSPELPVGATAAVVPTRAVGGAGGRASAASEAPANGARGLGERSVPEPAEPQLAPTSGRGSAADVLRLAAEGHDADTIARLTNRGREEVRLLLGTRH